MKHFLVLAAAACILISCSDKKTDKEGKQVIKKVEKNEYTITTDGIGDIKIGMKDAELEKLLNQKFTFRSVVDAPGYWSDTIKARYKDADVSLIFERMNGSTDSTYMELFGVETTSSLCKTEYGVGVGDSRSSIIEPYDDRAIYMGPEYEMINDSTWEASKVKYNVSVSDDKSGRNLIFHLTNKKIISLGAGISMGE